MTDPSSKPSFSAGRKWAFRLQAVVAVAAMLAIAVMLNYLAARHSLRFDFSAMKDRKLSPQTLRVLQLLTNDVRATVFFVAHSEDENGEEELFKLTTSLLREYSYANPKISVKAVDPSRHPVEAEAVLAQYKLTGLKDKNFIIFDCAGGTKVVYASELSEYDVNAVLSGQAKEFKRKKFNGEMLFTTAIFNLANPRQFKVCMLAGHGEHDPDKTDDIKHGYSKFATVLRERNITDIQKLSLLGTNEVPADCHLLVIAGARLPFAEAELVKIDRYLKQGGRLFVLVGNLVYTGGVRTGIEKLLAEWGIGVANNIVFDLKNCPSPNGDALLVAQINPEHPVTKALLSQDQDLRPLLVMPHAIGQSTVATNAANPDAPKVLALGITGAESTDTSDIRDGVVYRNPFATPSAFPVIVAAEQGRVRGITTERGSMRAIVVGDSLCLDNELIDATPANHYFAALAVDWLLDRPEVLLEGLIPRPLKSYRLTMTRQEAQVVRWIFLAGLPGAVLLLGGLVWLRRRS